MTREDTPSWAQGGLIASFRFATAGLLRTVCTQRNMKIHWVSGTAVMLVGMALELDLASRASVLFCVFVVVCMEVLNTALESFVDLHVKDHSQHAMVAKDAAAAAVLVLAFGSVVVFADILLHRWDRVAASGEAIQRTILLGIPLLIAEALILFIRRNVIVICLLGSVASFLVSALAWYSRDEVFSLGALSFVVMAAVARLAQPRLEPNAEVPS